MRNFNKLIPHEPPQDPEVTKAIRKAALDALPRIGVKQITGRADMLQRIEDLAMDLGDTVEKQRAAGDPLWWHAQDMLDDTLDMLDALRANVSLSA